MTSIKKIISKYIEKSMTANQAKNCACQEIILNKISKSPMSNKVLIKGGVLMFNLTHNIRRTTTDLDFDFFRYDISNDSLEEFIHLLNCFDESYQISIIKIGLLNQEDYQGKRVWVVISDKSTKIKFTIDIGVHTLFAIKQRTACFYRNVKEDPHSVFLN